MVISAIGVVALAVWVYLAFARGSFWSLSEAVGDDAARVASPSAWPSVGAVIPARNEREFIVGAASCLLTQDYPGQLDVVVVDDQSSDGTGDAVRKASNSEHGGGRRSVKVVDGRAPPSGWTGKLWAMDQGVKALGGAHDYVWFVDADIVVEENCLRRLVATAEAQNLVLASLMVKLKCDSAAERWLIPAFVFFFRMIYPFRWVNDPRRKTAAAAGGCMLIRRGSLEEAGHLSAVRGALIDDCALGRTMKRVGPISLNLSRDAISLRSYPDVKSFGSMVARSAFAQLDYSTMALAGVILAMSLVFLAPPLFVLFASGLPRLFGALAWIIMAALFAPTLKLYGRPAWTGLALPGIAAAYLVFTLQSAIEHWRGRGGSWKGRYQAPARVRRT
jgi:hopene-associated glycosyltransferase HpnB